MNWESVLKNEDEKTTQSKLPKELIPDGATVATRPIEEWFKGKGKKTKPVDNTKGTSQTSLGDFEKAEKPPAKYWDTVINTLMLSNNKTGIEQLIQGVKDNSTDNKGYTYDRVQILRAANRQMKEAEDEDEKELVQMILDGIPEKTRDERPFMKNNVQLILDGKHDEALEFFNKNPREQLRLKVWDEKNENKLSEYLKDKPELAAQLKFKLPQEEEDLKIKVDESKLTPTFLVEYLQMLYKVGEANVPYVPKSFKKLLGERTNPSLEWIMNNPNFNPSKFPTEGTVKQSNQQEAVYSMLRNDIFADEDAEVLEDSGKNVSEIIQELWNKSNGITEFRKLMENHKDSISLQSELNSKISGTENINYSIPQEDYKALMSVKDGELNELQLKLLEKYFPDIDEDDVFEFYEEYKTELERMKDNRSGGMRAASKEDGKKLIRLFGQQGSSKTLSVDTVDTDEDALESYLALARETDGANMFNLDNMKTQSATLPSVMRVLGRINMLVMGGAESLPRLVKKYGRDSSEENEKKVRDALSQSNYAKIRESFFEGLRKSIVDYMGSGDKSILHGRKKEEPYNWVKVRVESGN